MATCEVAAEPLALVVLGHVDHGKSTVVGRLLAEIGGVPDGRLQALQERCDRAGKRFEYAFLLDALADEQSQGITIEAARIHFRTDRRRYMLLDAPGHLDFLRNMVTGASRADAALLVIDAAEGVQENSRRHGHLASILGVRRLLVLVNKMDLVDWSEARFAALAKEYGAFLETLGVPPARFLPVSGLQGDNLASRSARMPWFEGPTLVDALDALEKPPRGQDGTLRMYVQDVYKFTRFGDSRRIVAGTVDSGSLGPGDEVVFYPSARRSRVRSLESFGRKGPDRAVAGAAVGFTLEEQIYVSRGELATLAGHARPKVSSRFLASVFWLGRDPLERNRDYVLKIGTASVPVRLLEVVRHLDAATLEVREGAVSVEANCVAECVLKVRRPVAFDEIDHLPETARFVLVDVHRIAGGGIVRKALEDPLAPTWEQRFARSRNWIPSRVSPLERAERYSQRPTLVLITGDLQADRKALGQGLEARLFADGRVAYFLGLRNILHGLDADLEDRGGDDPEHVRRLAEVANLMLDAGLVFIVSAAELQQHDLERIHVLVGAENVVTVLVGEGRRTDVDFDLHLPEEGDVPGGVERIRDLLSDRGILWRMW